MNQSLSSALLREVRPEFFRVLSGPLAPMYLDALDALERELAHRHAGMERDEAVSLIEQIVETYRGITSSADESFMNATTARDKARAVLDTLRQAGWLMEEDARSDYHKLIFFDANGVMLMQSLRKIAFPEATVFSDKLSNVCTTLANQDAMAEQPWAHLETCIENLQSGIAELRSMQKQIERHTRKQLASSTLKENLSLLFDQFAERIAHTCYSQLVHARLPSRLAEAKRAAANELARADLLEKMQSEVMFRDKALSPETAMARVQAHLERLTELLHEIEPLADAIDRRTAEFARRSQARFRYLQETTSENRARVQTFFETLNRHFSGQRVSDLEELDMEIPELLLHETRIIGGLESLYMPHLRRAAGEIEPMEDADSRQHDRALARLESTMRDSLTVSRANRFVSALPGESGSRLDSRKLLEEHIHNDEDIADLIACLLHARSVGAQYRIEVQRDVSDQDSGEFHKKLSYRIEHFALVKK